RGIAIGESRGIAIGEARGEARGEAKWKQSKALEIARNMVNLGLSEDIIITATGLEPETVKALFKSGSSIP
ncbi:MAG: hypothetical protein FWF22_02795, partial [Treponema sp.]|nr:hypothetical protein [Treponema sp.]